MYRPQTTRRRQLGILTSEDAQVVFVDTPGVHQPHHKLGKFLNQEAEEGLAGVDVILWLVDGSHSPDAEDQLIADLLMGLSQIAFDTGKNQKAVLYAEKAVDASPRSSSYRLNLGDAYYKVLRYRDALKEYQKAKELGSKRAAARIDKVKAKIG